MKVSYVLPDLIPTRDHYSVAKSGIFTSPNYPGLYPIDIICEYQLIGNSYEIIDLEFQEFDVESNSVRCSTDGDSDYVELRSCSTLSSILDLGKKYYCQNIEHDNNDNNKTIHVNWRKSCLIIKFFSNSMIVRHGFLAAYKFLLSESSHLRKDKTSSLLQILLVTLIHTYVHRTFEVNQYIMMV
ncbi:unnamed protein product [Heterobilharzia americana]|nr:unnamed protein product [Heterobilharzia americana]